MTLHVHVPPRFEHERRYVVDVVLGEWLGLDYCMHAGPATEVEITLGGDGLTLRLPDTFFARAGNGRLSERLLPQSALGRLDLRGGSFAGLVLGDELPVIYGEARGPLAIEATDKAVRLPIDIFGSAFFMLTRYEELVKPERDEHDRFPARASLAWREGFLERPIIDEYVEILWSCLKRLWPGLERGPRHYRAEFSHDVDHPLGTTGKGWRSVIRTAGGDLLRRRAPGLAARRLLAKGLGGETGRRLDPYNTFDFLMATSEAHGLSSTFYFMTGIAEPGIDGGYDPDTPWMRTLVRTIHDRGHAIGLHPSYHTYTDPAQTRRELERLVRVAEAAGVRREHWGGRQHYLRWRAPDTWRNYAAAGLAYDTTVGYADHVGFRCGTCREFPVFDIGMREALRLRERPLIAMEATLLCQKYMNCSRAEAYDRLARLIAVCRRYGGVFSLLWHNSQLESAADRRLYGKVAALAADGRTGIRKMKGTSVVVARHPVIEAAPASGVLCAGRRIDDVPAGLGVSTSSPKRL